MKFFFLLLFSRDWDLFVTGVNSFMYEKLYRLSLILLERCLFPLLRKLPLEWVVKNILFFFMLKRIFLAFGRHIQLVKTFNIQFCSKLFILCRCFKNWNSWTKWHWDKLGRNGLQFAIPVLSLSRILFC